MSEKSCETCKLYGIGSHFCPITDCCGYQPEPAPIKPAVVAGLTRKEFLALPMEERRRRLEEQAKQFVKEHGYLRDDPCDGHSTMIQPELEVKEVMPLITRDERERLIQKVDWWCKDRPTVHEECAKAILEAQRDADRKVLEAKEKEWREKEADWLEKWHQGSIEMTGITHGMIERHITELRKIQEGR